MSAPDTNRQDARWHGTAGGYTNHACRCDRCRKAIRDYAREYSHRIGLHQPRADYLAEQRAKAEARDNHGTESRYRLGCRCSECREALRVARGARRRRANQKVVAR